MAERLPTRGERKQVPPLGLKSSVGMTVSEWSRLGSLSTTRYSLSTVLLGLDGQIFGDVFVLVFQFSQQAFVSKIHGA